MNKSFALLPILLTGCLNGPGFMQQKGKATISSAAGTLTEAAAVVSDSDGVVTASLNANSNSTQLVDASATSALAGSGVSFPPGSVAIATDITLEEGVSLASDSVAQDLGVADASSLSAASSAMVISSSASTDAVQPFTVSLALGGSSLYLAEDGKELIVLYKIKKASDGGLYVGVIPNAELRQEGNLVSFEASHFGSYQAVYAAVGLAKIEKSTANPVVTKREEPSEDQPKLVTEIDGLRVKAVGTNFVDLAWKPAKIASGYVIRMVQDNKIDAGCRRGQFQIFNGQDTVGGRINGLSPGTLYTFRVCAFTPDEKESVGKIISQNTQSGQANTPDFFTVSPTPISSTRVRLTVVMPAGQTITPASKFKVMVVSGSTVPTSCDGGVGFSGATFESQRFPGNSVVAFRVCSVQANNAVGLGIGGTSTTLARDDSICNSGTLDTVCTVNTSHTLTTGTTISGIGTLELTNSSMIFAAPPSGTTPQALDIDVGTFNMQSGTSLNAFAMGFSRNSGPGQGTYRAGGSSGGGHAGEGGFGTTTPTNEIGKTYGHAAGMIGNDMLPPLFGSGGGSSSASKSSGGGVIRVRANAVDVYGLLEANGEEGDAGDGAGGAGGTIWFEANSMHLRSASSAQANGGSATSGGGGGGRLIFVCKGSAANCVNDSTIALYSAFGGTSSITDGGGAAGTVYFAMAGQKSLRISGQSGTVTNHARSALDLTETFYDSVVLDQSHVFLRSDNPATRIGTLSFTNAATLEQPGMGGSGGIGSSTAPQPGHGPASGSGGGGIAATSGAGGGGGHGGGGGASASGAPGGSAYGTAPLLNEPGSGGGGGREYGADGGAGGGTVRFDVNTLTMDPGTVIRTNGADGKGTSSCGGGGSGGAIFIQAQTATITGGTYFEAKGGAGNMCAVDYGGGGGGGIIKIVITTGSASATCTAAGGSGYSNGSLGFTSGC